MKYKVGDKVRIKSKEWYDKNKDKSGNVTLSDGYHFWKGMSRLLGCVLEIEKVIDMYRCYMVAENSYSISEEMIEGLATEQPTEPTLFDRIKSAIIEAGKQSPVIIEQTEDGGIKISPIEEKEDDLPIDTPCMVADCLDNWCFRYYAGENLCFLMCKNSKESASKNGWKYIIPFDKFNPNDIEESLKYNIVK